MFLFFALPQSFPNCSPCLQSLDFMFLLSLKQTWKTYKNGNLICVRTCSLPLCVVHIISVIPLQKMGFPFLKAISSWIGLEFVCPLPLLHAEILACLRMYKTCIQLWSLWIPLYTYSVVFLFFIFLFKNLFLFLKKFM